MISGVEVYNLNPHNSYKILSRLRRSSPTIEKVFAFGSLPFRMVAYSILFHKFSTGFPQNFPSPEERGLRAKRSEASRGVRRHKINALIHIKITLSTPYPQVFHKHRGNSREARVSRFSCLEKRGRGTCLTNTKINVIIFPETMKEG